MADEPEGLEAIRRAGHSEKTMRAFNKKYGRKKGCASLSPFLIASVALPVVIAIRRLRR